MLGRCGCAKVGELAEQGRSSSALGAGERGRQRREEWGPKISGRVGVPGD